MTPESGPQDCAPFEHAIGSMQLQSGIATQRSGIGSQLVMLGPSMMLTKQNSVRASQSPQVTPLPPVLDVAPPEPLLSPSEVAVLEPLLVVVLEPLLVSVDVAAVVAAVVVPTPSVDSVLESSPPQARRTANVQTKAIRMVTA